MKIIVTVKPVPDTTAAKNIDPATLRLNRTAATVLNPFDEFALEAALRLRDAHAGTTVHVIAMAPESAREALRKALGMGADSAALIADPLLSAADARLTAVVLAAAINAHGADLVVCGTVASDAGGAYVPRMLAQRLGFAFAGQVRSLEFGDRSFTAERNRDAVQETLRILPPALMTVTKEIGAVRYPSLKGIMAAKNKPLQIISCADIGIDVAAGAPAWRLMQVEPRSPRASAKILEPATAEEAARQIVAFLRERKAL